MHALSIYSFLGVRDAQADHRGEKINEVEGCLVAGGMILSDNEVVLLNVILM